MSQFYLISQAVGFQSQAKLSGKQEVLLTSKHSNAGLWEIEHSDYRVRFDAVGQKIKAGECVLFKHVNTAQWLAVDHFNFLTQMYGKEHEIFVHSYLKQSKSHNLASEQAGRVTIDIPLRGQEDQNAWVLISARSPQEDFDDRVIVSKVRSHTQDQPLQADRILDDLRETLMHKGSASLRQLRNMLYKIDTRQSRTMDAEDLRWGLRNIGVELSQAEVDLLIAAFDPKQSGHAEYEYILESINICTGPQRVSMIRDTYNDLNHKLGGRITVEGLAKMFDATAHPEVVF